MSQLLRILEKFSNRLPADYFSRCTRLVEALDLSFSKTFSSVQQAQLIDGVVRSEFVLLQLEKYPESTASIFKIGLGADQSGHYEDELNALLVEVTEESEFSAILRVFRNRHMLEIIWADMLGMRTVEQTMVHVSELADVLIRQAMRWLFDYFCGRFGRPKSALHDGAAPELLVIGMGKLGARELNVSSDIDLIFAYPEDGETDHPDKPIENLKFYTKLGQAFIQSLNQMTADGFVFRVDMRLRPYGQSGALVANFASLQDYYTSQARPWERYAMVKGRVITGASAHKRALKNIIQPFVYRRYTDFSSMQSLRDMKRLIVQEIARKGGDSNIKLGDGGIREIEFIVQACQLIYGGKDPALQTQSMLACRDVLVEKGYLSEQWVSALYEANAFLRRLEHLIQGLQDKQTQLLPADDLSQQRIAWAMQYASWNDLITDMNRHRQSVSECFSHFLHDDVGESDEVDQALKQWTYLWNAQTPDEDWVSAFQTGGFDHPEQALANLQSLRAERRFACMSPASAQRLDRFIPILINVSTETQRPDIVFERVLRFVKTILGRTVYLVLLYENRAAIRALCHLSEASPWIVDELISCPGMLDELLDSKTLYHLPSKSELGDELRQKMLRIPEEDQEAQIEALREFKHGHTLHVAAAELTKKLPLMKVSDYLTWLAEVIVDYVVSMAWATLIQRYGHPSKDGQALSGKHSGFAIIGYGKLGGIELNYRSDLDMVFLYDTDANADTVEGPKCIANTLFYTRLGQRVVHLLSANSAYGRLYEADMRLRPSGNSGMLVSTLRAYEKYQNESAWTWEHQALVRARAIAGDARVFEQFNDIRRRVLSQPRDVEKLSEDVRSMREKMRRAFSDKLGASVAKEHLKHGAGGLVDIEFITQFLVLKFAHNEPSLMQWTDNVRLIESLAAHPQFSRLELVRLIDIYRLLRAAQHRKSLADESYDISLLDFDLERVIVKEIWDCVFELT